MENEFKKCRIVHVSDTTAKDNFTHLPFASHLKYKCKKKRKIC